MDGSHHPWLGGQAPPFTLLIAVDDATGTVVDALFCEQEDAHSYFLLIRAWCSMSAYQSHSTPTGTGSSGTRPAPASPDANPVQPGHGRAGDSDDLCPVAPGQGARGAHGGHLPGPAGN